MYEEELQSELRHTNIEIKHITIHVDVTEHLKIALRSSPHLLVRL